MYISLTSLWMPVILSAVVVFVVSSLIWTVIGYHDSDWHKLPDEEAARSALRGATPGQYSVPHAATGKARKDEAWQARYKEGPAAMILVFPHGDLGMAKQLTQWFVYTLIISALVAYIAASTLEAGTAYLKVFQVVGTAGFLAYAGAAAMGPIWFGHSWGRAIKDMIDGLVYALLTAGIFGWLWP